MNIPLSVGDIGVQYVIKKISGKPEVRQHLENMGFVTGGVVRIVSENNGNLIIAVKESRVAVSKEMATRIYV
ncbi:MAG: ferrous iron transport protein A [Spirochaetaceae bacterium]|nr:ferrous iron transport protein A [Spirochaetaceae bacterium]MBO4705865.1 ferrous iron transport protein A [Spirochaetaceae bacterium]